MIQRFGRGELLKQPVRDDYVRFVGEETVQYVGNMASLSLDYYKEVFELGRTFNEKFFEQMTAGAARNADGAASATGSAPATISNRRVEIELQGAVGQEAARTFILESKQTQATDISFLISDFTGPQGTTPFRANLDFQPARFTLSPGEERVVTLRLPLDDKLFVAGLSYAATAVVRGYDDLELGLNVLPSAPVTTVTENVEPSPQAKTP